jgi:threonine/homoserine/homoserine lactone efflux protein
MPSEWHRITAIGGPHACVLDPSLYALFIGAALVLLLTPGPAVLYIVARSVHQGRVAGLVSCLGIGVGTLCHVVAAAFGLSALLMSSPVAFQCVKIMGTAYLIYLGIAKLRSREDITEAQGVEPETLPTIFRHGIVVNLLNPKTTLFIFAFLPQFVRIQRGSVATQILLLGITLVLLGAVTDGLWALLAGWMGTFLRGNLRFARAQRHFAGTVYIVLGLLTALVGTVRIG